MHNRLTLISHFDKKSNATINTRLHILGKTTCKVPFNKGLNNRKEIDTLPFHLTMCAWDIIQEKAVISKLAQLNFPQPKLRVTGLNIMDGKENSHCLYFQLAKNRELERIQREIYNLCPSEKYNPDHFNFHITIHIDQDYQKIIQMKTILEKDFKSIDLTITNFALYEIYPAKLIKCFN